jgi:hypothetical protein
MSGEYWDRRGFLALGTQVAAELSFGEGGTPDSVGL